MNKLLTVAIIGLLATSASAAIVCQDPAGDVAGNPGGGILDLLQVDATHDATHLQLTLTINGDIGATDWGKYLFFIDTAPGGGGTQFPDADPPTNNANPWVRNIAIGDPNRAAEWWIGTWADWGGGSQLWQYTGVGSPQWNNTGGAGHALLPGAISQITYSIPLATLGVGIGDTIYLEAFSSGGGSFDTANDTCNDPNQDWIWPGGDWNQQASVRNSGSYFIPEPVTLTLFGVAGIALLRRRR
jgi:hypothetical protein